MVRLILPPGDYSIRPRGSQVEILSLDRELTREEVAAQLGRTERSIDLYRALSGPAQLKSRRTQGRIFIRESELVRWLSFMKDNPDELPNGSAHPRDTVSDRPRKKRRTRLDFEFGSKSRANAENPSAFNGTT